MASLLTLDDSSMNEPINFPCHGNCMICSNTTDNRYCNNCKTTYLVCNNCINSIKLQMINQRGDRNIKFEYNKKHFRFFRPTLIDDNNKCKTIDLHLWCWNCLKIRKGSKFPKGKYFNTVNINEENSQKYLTFVYNKEKKKTTYNEHK